MTKKSVSLKIFNKIVILVLLLLVTFAVINSIKKYRLGRIAVQISEESISSIKFPQMNICSGVNNDYNVATEKNLSLIKYAWNYFLIDGKEK